MKRSAKHQAIASARLGATDDPREFEEHLAKHGYAVVSLHVEAQRKVANELAKLANRLAGLDRAICMEAAALLFFQATESANRKGV